MEGEMPNDHSLTTGYAPVNDLNVYFEIHGEGEPVVLLHGAYMNVDGMAPLLEPLAEQRQVIALELQGHGRTADADRLITYEGMAAEAIEMFPTITPEMFKGGPMSGEYKRLAPNPGDFENLVWKLKTLDTTDFD